MTVLAGGRLRCVCRSVKNRVGRRHGEENIGEHGGGIAVGAPGEIYVVGSTESVGTFTTTPGAWDTTLEGNYDGFLVKLGIGTDLSVQTSDLVDPVYLPPAGTGMVQYSVIAGNEGPLTATGVQVPIRFLGRVKYKVMTVAVLPASAGTWLSAGAARRWTARSPPFWRGSTRRSPSASRPSAFPEATRSRSSLRGHRSQQISRISTPPTTRTTRER